ncbi:MAG: tetratricopeptide repeat protein [Steroidobacteraceae bacterium]
MADFPDGFILDDTDMNFDRLGDLSIITEEAADNVDAAYWIYEPATKHFVALERIGGGDNEVTLSPGPDHLLFSRVKGSLLEYTEYAYRISGHRAVAVSTESREIEGQLIVDVREDLRVTPNRVTRRTVVGFLGESPARRAFLKELDAASDKALSLYRRGNPAGAAAAVGAVVKGRKLALVTSSYPITGDPGDLTLVRQFNDYGFYLEQAKQPKQAIGVLAQVTDVDPNRTVAYLNLADADYSVGRMADAKANYSEYRQRMAASGKLNLMPARVAARLGSAPAPE